MIDQGATRPKVGIGACLTGQSVRFNGGHKKTSGALKLFNGAFELTGFCPEVAIGLGVPRQPIRLVNSAGQLKAMDSDSQRQDFTESLKTHAEEVSMMHEDMAGYIFVKGSPSCGYQRVKVYNEEGALQSAEGTGIFAQRLMQLNPLLPVEEDGRLNDHRLRESFIRRVYAFHDWQQLMQTSPSFHQLVNFYTRYKYLVMACHLESYKAIGKLLSHADKQNPQSQAEALMGYIMNALKYVETRKGFSNALSHIKGYLKRKINTLQRTNLDTVIRQYSVGEVPLVVPLTLLNHYFTLYPHDYIQRQVMLSAYPSEFGIGNY